MDENDFMNELNFDQKWHFLELGLTERFGKKPDMEAILFLIGINEYRGKMPSQKFSKEQKQDLMHVAVCSLLSKGGYYELKGFDEEGWPHYLEIEKVNVLTLEEQEHLLKHYIIDYFENETE